MADATAFTLFGNEDVYLDRFQQTLLNMSTNASANALSKFFAKNYRPLYQFLLRMYLSSLTDQHPARGRVNAKKKQEKESFTVNEHQIIAEWANLLTEDEPANQEEQTAHANNRTMVIDVDGAIGGANDQGSPRIASSNTSKAKQYHAKVDDQKRRKKSKEKTQHDHSNSQKSFSGFAQFTTAIAMMRSRPNSRQQFAQYDGQSKKKKGVRFDPDSAPPVLDSDDMKKQYHKNRNNQSRRESIWDGVLDVNNVIMVPETPKWRPRFSFQQNALMAEGLLDCIITTLSPKGYNKQTLTVTLEDEINVTSVDALSLFLPFVCVISGKLSSKKKQEQLRLIILKRVVSENDIRQHFEFFLHSYKDSPELIKAFKKINLSNMNKERKAIKPKKEKSPSPSPGPQISSMISNIQNMDDVSLGSMSDVSSVSSPSASASSSPSMKGKPQIITQAHPESAISIFSSIFRRHLVGGSEIKLCPKSTVRDPINANRPPLSRIEIRKIIQSNSKPYLIDLYVANRVDNFEFLSSTVILKKGDDLRRDTAVLHVFRMMNKIWREKGLEFTQVPVHALTYKCVAMSPQFGCLELIEGCKPLRLVSALEDTITIAQQFNLVASAVGSYIGAFVMGIRDRHFDNVLIRDSDCTLFHIDFGFVLGETASVDTSKFAITQDLKKLMGVFWDKFIELGVQAYLALRDKHQYLIKFARMAFSHLAKGDEVEAFIKAQLHIDDLSDDKAAKYIARKLKEAPESVRTKFKNVVHQIATYKK